MVKLFEGSRGSKWFTSFTQILRTSQIPRTLGEMLITDKIHPVMRINQFLCHFNENKGGTNAE